MRRRIDGVRQFRGTSLARGSRLGVGRGVLLALGVAVFALAGSSASAFAAGGANFIATGHDMDYHCSEGTTEECAYLKIVVDKVRKGSTLPILALDQGSELPTALAKAGYTGAGEVVKVNPAEATEFNATAFVDSEGHPKYSAIITASDETCGGCDNTEAGENNINARAADFETFFNGGGGILALAGAERFTTYYNFVPLHLAGTAVSPPFTVTPEGAALGVTNEDANCCATHNSFEIPAAPFVVLEDDGAGKAETIGAFEVGLSKEGFSSLKPTSLSTTLSGEGHTGASINVYVGSAVADSATLSGEHASKATGAVEYAVYSDAACTKLVTAAGKVTPSAGTVPASEAKTLGVGTYYWQAKFAGDPLNQASASGCGSEVLNVIAKPKAEVLAAGTAKAASVHACLASAGYTASVTGTSIASVSFSLDGHKVATVSKPNSHGAFTAHVRVHSGSKHHLTMHVTFLAASHTASTTLRRTLARCAAHVVVKPKPQFTG